MSMTFERRIEFLFRETHAWNIALKSRNSAPFELKLINGINARFIICPGHISGFYANCRQENEM